MQEQNFVMYFPIEICVHVFMKRTETQQKRVANELKSTLPQYLGIKRSKIPLILLMINRGSSDVN